MSAGKKNIAYETLDNGLLSCEKPQLAQRILDQLTEDKIERMIRKWLSRLPSAFTKADERAGFRYELSILQAEFALTQVFERPTHGRQFFEEVIKENWDLGRPQHVSMIFDRRVNKRTPGKFQTRVITEGVSPSLHVSYKNSKIKQYFKEGRALRTETVINNTRDFGIGRKLENLPALREVGFRANRRLLQVQKVSQNCMIGEEQFEKVTQRQLVDGRVVAALRFGDPRVMALMQGLTMFAVNVQGFSNATLREHIAQLLGKSQHEYKPSQMSYDLCRLRLNGIIERIPSSHRYRLTAEGMHICLFFTKVHGRVIRGGLSHMFDELPGCESRALVSAMRKIERAMEEQIANAKLAA